MRWTCKYDFTLTLCNNWRLDHDWNIKWAFWELIIKNDFFSRCLVTLDQKLDMWGVHFQKTWSYCLYQRIIKNKKVRSVLDLWDWFWSICIKKKSLSHWLHSPCRPFCGTRLWQIKDLMCDTSRLHHSLLLTTSYLCKYIPLCICKCKCNLF